MAKPNQKIIIISKENTDKGHPFSMINLEAIDNAAIKLKDTAFKLWIYLGKNQNHYRLELSQVSFCNWCGATKPTYLKAVRTLIEQGFLVPKKENSNVYTFYEYPTDETMPTTENDLSIAIPEEKVIEINKFRF